MFHGRSVGGFGHPGILFGHAEMFHGRSVGRFVHADIGFGRIGTGLGHADGRFVHTVSSFVHAGIGFGHAVIGFGHTVGELVHAEICSVHERSTSTQNISKENEAKRTHKFQKELFDLQKVHALSPFPMDVEEFLMSSFPGGG